MGDGGVMVDMGLLRRGPTPTPRYASKKGEEDMRQRTVSSCFIAPKEVDERERVGCCTEKRGGGCQ